jgi:hypothetical protein
VTVGPRSIIGSPPERAFAALLLAACALGAGPALAAERSDRALSVYGAVYSPNRLVEILGIRGGTVRLDDASGLLAVAISQEVGRTGTVLEWSVEGQLVQHFGVQRHQEVNAVFIVRWVRFPWDRHVHTSLGFGQGLSYAFREPEFEPRRDADLDSSKLLNYLLVEVAAGAPDSHWHGFVRVHHRSGVFGLYGDVHGGSNFIGVGFRYRF